MSLRELLLLLFIGLLAVLSVVQCKKEVSVSWMYVCVCVCTCTMCVCIIYNTFTLFLFLSSSSLLLPYLYHPCCRLKIIKVLSRCSPTFVQSGNTFKEKSDIEN